MPNASQILKVHRSGQYEPMTYEAYKAAERQFYLSRSLEEITEERFNEAYEVLPPKAVRNADGVFSFLMIEHWHGPYRPCDRVAAI
jgi:hypothetical protein